MATKPEIKIYENEVIKESELPQSGSFENLVDKPVELSDINATEGAFLALLLASNLTFKGGEVQTTDDAAAVVDLMEVTSILPLYFMVKVKCVETVNGYTASFDINVSAKLDGGIAKLNPMQEVFVVRDQDYDVDFTNEGTMVQLRIVGASGQTVNWTYSAIILN